MLTQVCKYTKSPELYVLNGKIIWHVKCLGIVLKQHNVMQALSLGRAILLEDLHGSAVNEV